MTLRDALITLLLVIVLVTIFFRPPWQWAVALCLAFSLVLCSIWWLR